MEKAKLDFTQAILDCIGYKKKHLMVQKNGDWHSLGHWINFIMYYYKKNYALYKEETMSI